ncbi:hypothetical protein AQUCO_03700227v1 [Aquilegia coerulea]|uniref:Uncharacterized protein n=1 Tax=Aquilegia coerulea TaxID=218851 RepID=A0A2G5CU48_AQUCA|nr:hypothetical protein AQUCO_03700227v1 [Aquilegia coerulea]
MERTQSQMESGVYITSYAAAMFIAAMVTIGVLFITIIATLTVMLRSCQNRDAGVLQLGVRSDEKMFILQAELNRLEVEEFPSICKTHIVQYFKEGDQYLRDLKWTIWMIHSYLNSLKPHADGLDVVLMDLDDILNVVDDKHEAAAHILDLYTKLQASGWSLILITRKHETLHNVTMETSISSGYKSWSSLIMRSDDEMLMESWAYFSNRRAVLQKLDFRISSVISSHMDALTGPCLGKRVFKLPSPPN